MRFQARIRAQPYDKPLLGVGMIAVQRAFLNARWIMSLGTIQPQGSEYPWGHQGCRGVTKGEVRAWRSWKGVQTW